MMLCEDVQKLTAEYLAGTLDEARQRELTRHLQCCPQCHHAVEEARLAGLVLEKAGTPPPPEALASNIKSAVRTRMVHRARPIHERALGSPAFMATCASLLCGAIICLAAIWRVAAVPTADTPAATLAQEQAPAVVQSLVTVQPRRAVAAVPHRPRMAAAAATSRAGLTRALPRRHVARLAAGIPSRPVRRLAAPAPVTAHPRVARGGRTAVMAVRPASHAITEDVVPVSFLTPSRQRTSLPDSRGLGALTEPVRAVGGYATDLPTSPEEATPVLIP